MIEATKKRLPTTLLLLCIYLTVFSNFLSSWIPSFAGFSFGGIARDFAVFLFYAIVVTFSRRLAAGRYYFTLLITVFFLVFYTLVLIADASNISTAILGARNFLLFCTFGVCSHMAIEGKFVNVPVVVKHIVFIAFLLSALGISEVVTEGASLEWLGYRKDFADFDLFNLVAGYLGYTRATAGVGDSLNFGYLMAFLSIFLLFDRHLDKTLLKRSVTFACFGLASLSVFLSLTRGALLVWLLGVLAYLMFRVKLSRVVLVCCIGASLVPFALTTEYGDLLLNKFFGGEKYATESSEMRVDMARESIQILSTNPLGIGLGSQGAGLKFAASDTRVNTDNFFFIVFLEWGIIGFLFISVLYFLLLTRALKFGAGYAAFMSLAFLISGMLSSALTSPLVAFFFWLCMSLGSFSGKYYFGRDEN